MYLSNQTSVGYNLHCVHDLLLNSNSDLHWSLLGTFILKKNIAKCITCDPFRI